MKKIHRVLAMLMAVVMALSLITTAFAEPTIDGTAWNYDVTVYPKNQTGNPTLDKTVREDKNSTGKNTGSLTNI